MHYLQNTSSVPTGEQTKSNTQTSGIIHSWWKCSLPSVTSWIQPTWIVGSNMCRGVALLETEGQREGPLHQWSSQVGKPRLAYKQHKTQCVASDKCMCDVWRTLWGVEPSGSAFQRRYASVKLKDAGTRAVGISGRRNSICKGPEMSQWFVTAEMKGEYMRGNFKNGLERW